MAVTGLTDTMFAGDRQVFRFTVVDEATDDPVDLTGLAPVFALARVTTNGAFGKSLLEKTIAAGITVTDAAAGILEVELVAADTAGLVGSFEFRLRLVEDDEPVTIAAGTLTIAASIPIVVG